MSYDIKAIVGPNLDVNMVPGRVYDSKEPLVIRIRIGEEESVVTLEHFCFLAERYLQGGAFGWRSEGNPDASPMPECVKKTIKRLVQHL